MELSIASGQSKGATAHTNKSNHYNLEGRLPENKQPTVAFAYNNHISKKLHKIYASAIKYYNIRIRSGSSRIL
jgi:hypothetical protein